MLIIPAIDLKDGCVVRYVQGKLNKKVYSKDPIKTARHWVKNGAEWLHIIDLDGAFSGTPKNINIVKELAESVDAFIEFGGGVRDFNTIEKLFSFGIDRVVLGTRAIEDKVFLKKAFKKFGGKIMISIDAKEGRIMTKGWNRELKNNDSITFAKELKKTGFEEVIYTDTLKDGTLTGPNLKGIKALAKGSGLNIIASGGISSLEDISNLKKLEKQGVVGVIVGKALYEGRFSLGEALKRS